MGELSGFNPLISNRRGSIISYNCIRKEKISNAINYCYQVNPLFQNFVDPGLNCRAFASVDFFYSIFAYTEDGDWTIVFHRFCKRDKQFFHFDCLFRP